MNEKLPKLMVDSSEKDGKAEIVMDYVLSWCLRRADEICQRDKSCMVSLIQEFF